jgi:murein DD-endopeptidase MepM/ murein hydrolase activator NlpD
MKLYRPIKTLMIAQRWGVNGKWYQDNGINIKGHNGYDLMCYRGEPVYHSGDFKGWVKTEVDNRGGIGVRVISKEKQGDLGYVTLIYWHFQKVAVHDKQEVVPGQLIGYGDSTGFSTGDHVHFALKQCTKTGNSLNTNNGYHGAIDHTRWWDRENRFILDILGVKPDQTIVVTLLKKLLSLISTGLDKGILTADQAKAMIQKVVDTMKGL